MNRKLNISTTTTDWVLEMFCLVGLIATIAVVLIAYSELPPIIPRHFTGNGEPDGFGTKSYLLILPATSAALYLLLTASLMYPNLVNYPVPITISNAERQYRNLFTMTRVLKVIVVSICLYLTFATIQISRGTMDGLGLWFVPVMLLTIFGTVAFFIYRGFRLR